MKKLFLLTIVICSYTTIMLAQNYKKYTELTFWAHYYYSENNTDSSLFYFEKAFEKVEIQKPIDMNYAARCYAEKKDTVGIIRCVKYMIEQGYTKDEITRLKAKKKFKPFANSLFWKELEKVKSNIDYDIIIEIENWFAQDQFVRLRFFKDTCMKKYMAEIDSINCYKLIDLIKNKGFPGNRQIGRYTGTIGMLLMHIIGNESTKHYWEDYFKPLVLEEAEKGNFSYGLVAILTDRYSWVWDGNLTYGLLTERIGEDENSKYSCFFSPPIKDIKNVDKRRAEIGLPPLKYFAKSMNAKLPEGYIYKP